MKRSTAIGGIGGAVVDEFRALREDRWLGALVIWLPIVLSMILLGVFASGLPRQLPVGVVDLDHSSLSRKVIRYLGASPGLAIAGQYASMQAGQPDIEDASIYALIVIPEDLERDVARGRAPAITTFFNAQYLLIAKSLRSTLFQIEGTIAAELDVARIFASSPVLESALDKALPVRVQLTSLYNQNLNYTPFLVPGLIVALLQVLACSVAVLSTGREFKSGKLDCWRRGDPLAVFIGKTCLYTALFSLHGLVLLFVFFGVLDWPHHGAVIELVPVLILFILASQILGSFFYVLTFNQERSLSLAGAFSAPAFAFLGVTFPASGMSVFAGFWRDLMPASHFMDAWIIQISYAGGTGALFRTVLILMLFAVLLPWVIHRLRTKIEEHDVSVYSTA